ncbi:hypothetical protein Hsw_1766 [Hymenobacter swuensis DY53]|uniref:Uncharacterized protein n=1 Tax=Hymenobacter swuensis DY53 TaxID=1227739 RepID=W8F446_9BACT|nr:hypothetical protein Hsw_1766 [Hymenobacter swuensis DY53]
MAFDKPNNVKTRPFVKVPQFKTAAFHPATTRPDCWQPSGRVPR